MASVEELTAQLVALTSEVQTLRNRVAVAEQNLAASAGQNAGGGAHGSNSGVFDKKRLYPEKLKEEKYFTSWADDVLQWIALDNEDVAKAFDKAGKQEEPLALGDLSATQLSYSKAVYSHLRSLTQGLKTAARIVRSVPKGNGLEAWRRLVKKFDPQNPEVHAAKLQGLITYGVTHKAKSISEVPFILNEFERALEEYTEATGTEGINEATKKTIMIQICPPELRKGVRDTIMAAQKTQHSITSIYLHTIIKQRCEFDDAAMGEAVPMDANQVDEDDAWSLGQRAVGPGADKGGGRGNASQQQVSDWKKLPPGGTGGWEKYNVKTNNGFPPGTCGGCGSPDHFRKDCPLNPSKGKPFPKAKAKPKAKAFGRGGRRVAAVEEEEG